MFKKMSIISFLFVSLAVSAHAQNFLSKSIDPQGLRGGVTQLKAPDRDNPEKCFELLLTMYSKYSAMEDKEKHITDGLDDINILLNKPQPLSESDLDRLKQKLDNIERDLVTHRNAQQDWTQATTSWMICEFRPRIIGPCVSLAFTEYYAFLEAESAYRDLKSFEKEMDLKDEVLLVLPRAESAFLAGGRTQEAGYLDAWQRHLYQELEAMDRALPSYQQNETLMRTAAAAAHAALQTCLLASGPINP